MVPSAHRDNVLHVLQVLADTGIAWATLTNERSLAQGDATSDIDVIVELPASRVVDAAAPRLRRLVPIVQSPYDVGTISLFIVPPEGGHRVQLDLLHDPHGLGKYGFRSGVLLERRQLGDRWPTVAPTDSLLYEIRKRIVKRDAVRLGSLVVRAKELGLSSTNGRIGEVFSPSAAASVRAVLSGGGLPPSRRSFSHRMATVGRYRGRLSRPVGFWAHVDGDDLPAFARTALAPLLPHVRLEPFAGGRLPHLIWWIRRVAPVRWRPGLMVSWGDLGSGRPRPDLLIPKEASAQDIVPMTTGAMSRRFTIG